MLVPGELHDEGKAHPETGLVAAANSIWPHPETGLVAAANSIWPQYCVLAPYLIWVSWVGSSPQRVAWPNGKGVGFQFFTSTV